MNSSIKTQLKSIHTTVTESLYSIDKSNTSVIQAG